MVWEVSFSSFSVVLWYSILSFPVNTSGITSYFSKSYQNLWTLFLFCYFIVFMFIDLPFDLLHPFLPLPHTSLLATTNLFYFYWSIYLFFYISLSSYFFLITEFIALSICYMLITGLISWDTSGNQIEKNASPVEEITGGFREQKWQAIISNIYVD